MALGAPGLNVERKGFCREWSSPLRAALLHHLLPDKKGLEKRRRSAWAAALPYSGVPDGYRRYEPCLVEPNRTFANVNILPSLGTTKFITILPRQL